MASRNIVAFGLLYVLLFGALGAEVSYLPLLLATNGLSAPQIGFILTAGTITQVLVAPMLGLAADRLGRKLVLAVSAAAAAASLLLFVVVSPGAGHALLVYMVFAMAAAPLNPLADALSVPACLKAGVPYGRVRGMGSAGFFAGILLSGAMAARHGIGSIVPTAAAFLGLLAVAVIGLPDSIPHPEREEQAPSRHEADGTLWHLLADPGFRRVLLVAALVIGGHAVSDAFAVIHWAAIGIDAQTIGILLAVAVGSEFLVFVAVGPMLLSRFRPSTCAIAGATAGILRWAILAEAHSVWPLVAAQLMHGLTFSLVHLACMRVLAVVAPRRFFATAQSLYGICSNAIASGVVTLAAGAMFASLHGHAFLLASGLCVLAVPFASRLGLDQHSDRVDSGRM